MNSVRWELTQRCNLKCRHCFVGKIDYDHDVPIDKARDLLDKMKKLGVNELILSTKEPFAYPYICELLEYCAELDFFVTLVTNGTLISDQVLDSLSLCKVKALSVSLEGISAETNDYVRGEGVFEKVIDAVERINKLNNSTKYYFPLALQISLTSKNITEVGAMIDWFENSPFLTVNVGDIAILGNAEDNVELKLSEKEYDKAVKVLLENYSKLDSPSFILNLKKSTPLDTIYYNSAYGLAMECVVPSCAAYHGYYSVLPNGDTCSCVALIDDEVSSCGKFRSRYNLLRDGVFENSSRIDGLAGYKEDAVCKGCIYNNVCELCLLIVYDENKLEEARRKCKCAQKRINTILRELFLGNIKFRLNPHAFIYEQEGKLLICKISQTGTVKELNITACGEYIKELFLNNRFVSIDFFSKADIENKMIEELMYNDMLQIMKEDMK